MGLYHPMYKVSLVDGEPKLFLEQTYRCRNKKCSNFEKDVDIARNEITNVEEDTTE